ncbi:MAG TPA: response regulator [Nitrospinota bacterium]|jgi:CheY-like chemotaxis protein|nr:response regulator [Nitrospinota bacterium]
MESKVRILIVEDQFLVANDIKDNLETLGYEISAIATSGEKAVKKAGEGKTDLVLMDIVLRGEMDGIEAAEIIRSRFDLPVIFLTAYRDPKIFERAKISEPFGYLIKPFEASELHSNVEIALYKHKIEIEKKEAGEERKKLIHKLKEDLAEVNKLSGLLPICASCKKIRNEEGNWNQIEEYLSDRSEVKFSHGVCPECAKNMYPDIYP